MGTADLALGERMTAADPSAMAERADQTRLRVLVVDHVDFIWRSLRRLGVSEADLGDAAQQVFLVAARKLARIQIGSERGFLFQTALRVASDTRRSRRRRREVGDEILNEHEHLGMRPDEYAEERRRRAELERVLETLPLELRAVFVLSEIEEMTMVEIAGLTGTPPGTVASRLRRARALFREQVGLLHERERTGRP